MTKALIAFGSTTGNTAEVANWIAAGLGKKGIEAKTEDCANAKVSGLCGSYDLVVLGCPTYGDDEIEIQDDFLPLLEDLEAACIDGKKVAVFGCGDDSYFHFCGAVDEIEKRVRECGGELITASLKINDPHTDRKDEILAWSDRIADAI
jgi:flavodoxin short chain